MGNVTVTGVNYLDKNNIVIYLSNGVRMLNSYGKNIVEKNGKGEIKLDSYYWNYSLTTSKGRCVFLNEKKAETEKKIKSGEYKLIKLN